MMTGQTVCGFRDSSSLYYPLFHWIDAQWATGKIPLWNPYHHFGIPVVGDGTSSLFYPGKIIFFFRFLSFPARYGIYLAVHVLIAGLGAYWFARVLRANRAGALLAAFAYALGGSVLFQLCNVIYLVSAAWLPFALGCVWRMVHPPARSGSPQASHILTILDRQRWAVGAGVCCALMILGGDPQMVYHVGLIAGVTIASQFLQRAIRSRHKQKMLSPTRWLAGASARLSIMIGTTILLALVQLMPTMEWARKSERTNPPENVNVWSLFIDRPESPDATERHTIWEAPQPGSIVDHAYQFSQPPWSFLELFWPQGSGKPFPLHRRWTDQFPGADRVWVPSLYLGGLVALIGMGGFRGWGRRRKHVWLTRVGLFFVIGSLGWYGAIWLVEELIPNQHFTRPLGPQAAIGPQVGGLYWAMVVFLPKYFAFRYPAKLFVIGALSLSLLAGLQLRTWRPPLSLRTGLIGILSAGVALLLLQSKTLQDQMLGNVPPHPLFGPFDRTGCLNDLQFGLVQVILLFAAGTLLLGTRLKNSRKRTALWAIVGLTAFDLILANGWMTAEIPSRVLTTQVTLDELPKRPVPLPATISRLQPFFPEPQSWAEDSSQRRLEEIVAHDRQALYHQHFLNHPVRLVGTLCSIWPEAYETFLATLEHHRTFIPAPDHSEAHTEAGPSEWRPSELEQSYCDGTLVPSQGSEASDLKWFGHPSRIVVVTDLDISTVKKELANVDQGKTTWNLERALQPIDPSEGTWSVRNFGIDQVEVFLKTDSPKTLLLNTFSDGNWQVTITNIDTGETKSASPLEMGGFFLGTRVGPGEHKIVFAYQPLGFWIGAWISGLSWGLIIAGYGYNCSNWRTIDASCR